MYHLLSEVIIVPKRDLMETRLKGQNTKLNPGETKAFEFELSQRVCDIFIIPPLQYIDKIGGEYRAKVWVKAYLNKKLVRDRPAYPGLMSIIGGPGKVRVEMKNTDTIPSTVKYGAEVPATKTPIKTVLKK